MNLGQLRTAVRARMGIPTNDSLFPDPVLNELINSANHYLETEWDWPWLEATEDIPTVNGQSTYTPAATSVRTIDLRINQNVVLRQVPVEELDWFAGPGTGDPRIFASTPSGQITLFPTPSGTVTLKHRYVRTEPELAIDSDTPLVPSSFHPAIVEYAAHSGFRRGNEDARSKVALAAYETWLEQMRRRTNRYADSHGGGAEANAQPGPKAAAGGAEVAS